MIKRFAENSLEIELLRFGHNNDVILIEGARQVGKTTIANSVIEKLKSSNKFHGYHSFNLETDLELRDTIDKTKSFQEFENLLEARFNFQKDKNSIIFLDEAQESSLIGKYVRSMKENWPNTKVMLSGSSMKRLFRSDTRVPVGRTRRIKIPPLLFSEALPALGGEHLLEGITTFPTKAIPTPTHNELLKYIDIYFQTGGLPDVVLAKANGDDFSRKLRSILLYQEEDFCRKESKLKHHLFMACMRGVANYVGFPSKYTHVVPENYWAKEIISVMKAWHLVLEVETKGNSSTTSFAPKRYVYDVGICQQIRAMPFPELSLINSFDSALRTQIGGVFENMVFLHLDGYMLGDIEVSAWKKNNKEPIEVDFIVRADRKVCPIECKATLNVTNRNFSSLVNYLKASNQKIGFLVSLAPFQVFKIDNFKLINIPFYLLEPRILSALYDVYSKN
jgi:uncharacterized protein